jgi:hypothetical protein
MQEKNGSMFQIFSSTWALLNVYVGKYNNKRGIDISK